MNQYFNAAQGLKKMFIAQIGTIICTVCTSIAAAGTLVFAAAGSLGLTGLFGLLTLVGAIGAIVFAIINLVGLNGAGKDIEGCKTAFTIAIISIVVTFCGNLMQKKVPSLALLFTLAGLVLSFLITYYVCTSVSGVMASIGARDIADSGNNVWKIYLACNIIQAVIAILNLTPVLSLLAGIGSIANLVVALVGLILYMIFLHKSSKALGA